MIDRNQLYEGIALLGSIRIRVIWNGHPDWQESCNLLKRLDKELRDQVNEITDPLDSSGPGYYVPSLPVRVER